MRQPRAHKPKTRKPKVRTPSSSGTLAELDPGDFVKGEVSIGTTVTWRERGTVFGGSALRTADGWLIEDQPWTHKDLTLWLAMRMAEKGLSIEPWIAGTGPFPLEFISFVQGQRA